MSDAPTFNGYVSGHPDSEESLERLYRGVMFPKPPKIPPTILAEVYRAEHPCTAPPAREEAPGNRGGGLKYDKGKAAWDLIPTMALAAGRRFRDWRRIKPVTGLIDLRDGDALLDLLDAIGDWRRNESTRFGLDILTYIFGVVAENFSDRIKPSEAVLDLLGEVGRVLDFGAIKYEPNSWQTVANGEARYFSAMHRHLKAYQAGEDRDADSGMPHLAHAACNLAFLLGFRDGVDRPFDRDALAAGIGDDVSPANDDGKKQAM